MVDDNPYAAPQSSFEPLISPGGALPLATQGQRFLNFFIDGVVFRIIQFVCGYVWVDFALESGVSFEYFDTARFHVTAIAVDILIAVLYYVVLEGLTGRTIGKLLTGTKVVAEEGGVPTFGQIVGRSLSRLIPFEPFSFLGKQPIGWHDTIPKTRVVKIR